MQQRSIRKLILLTWTLALPACASDWWARHFGQDGVALVRFDARDGSYFPEFVCRFFGSTTDFQKAFPTVSESRDGVKLIQVRNLTDGKTDGNEANLSWSADGVYLSFEADLGGKRKILLKDLVGDFASQLLVVPKAKGAFLDGLIPAAIQSYNSGLSWSRDSTRYAFTSNGGVGDYSIYVGAVGVKEKQIARSRSKDGYAAWNPRNNEIAFMSARSGNGDIYLFDLNSDKVNRLTTSDDVDIFPEWSPNGRMIVYSSGDSLRHALFTVERAASGGWQKPTQLTEWDHDLLRPTVSPDGKYIAFYVDDETNGRDGQRQWHIAIMPAVSQKLSTENLNNMIVAKDVVIDLNTGPAWSPDGRKIFYVKRDPELFNPIFAFDLFNGQRYQLQTSTKMNRDILMSRLGILSFRAQVGVWDRVFVALTNQGLQLQNLKYQPSRIHYERL